MDENIGAETNRDRDSHKDISNLRILPKDPQEAYKFIAREQYVEKSNKQLGQIDSRNEYVAKRYPRQREAQTNESQSRNKMKDFKSIR